MGEIYMCFNKILIIVLIIGVTLFGCSNSTSEPDPVIDPLTDMIKIGESTQDDTKIEVYSVNTPAVGYNKLFIKMINTTNNETVTNGTIQIIPIMDMGTMKHSAPFENAIASTDYEGIFEGAVNFIMSGMWEITIQFQNDDNDKEGEFNIEFEVNPSSMVKSALGPDSLKYFISLVEPVKPQVGLNNFEITLHCRENMMFFPAIEDFDIQMEPSMPSMGHGSPNNVNPVHELMGHYVGEVNFTMTGDWLVELDFWKDDSLFHVEYEIYVP
jgi:hypothetical protein